MSRRAIASAFRNPMVWLVVGLPALSIVMGTIYAVIAFRVFDGVVVDDYYKRGRAINRVLARDRAAEAAGLLATVDLEPASGGVAMRLDSADLPELPANVTLRFLHATRAGVDRTAEMRSAGSGRYRGEIAPLAPGKYHLQLETERWRIVGLLLAPDQTGCELAPAL